MSKKTQTDTATAEWMMEDIYNILMVEIEPELLTDAVPMLDELYAEESPEEKKERGERYARAFVKFQERFTEFCESWKKNLLEIKKTHLSALETRQHKEEQAHMQNIEDSFGASL